MTCPRCTIEMKAIPAPPVPDQFRTLHQWVTRREIAYRCLVCGHRAEVLEFAFDHDVKWEPSRLN